ncbi:MAG: hypothetical protein WDW36_003197 [Sanguina aurantia]
MHPNQPSSHRAKFMGDLLGAVSSDSSDDEGAAAGPGTAQGEEAAPQPKRNTVAALTVEDLRRVGYSSGPSLLFMRTQEQAPEQDYSWGDGKAAREQEPEEESVQERAATRKAVTSDVEHSMVLSRKAVQHGERLREMARAEKEEMKTERHLSYNQKEKRKRDEGKQSHGKNYVEEEKRMARAHGIYSGFD